MADLDSRVAVVTEGGPHVWAIVNAIAGKLGPVTVILETPESKSRLLKRRIRKQGFVSVGGQLATMVLIRLGKRFLARRMQRIISENAMETAPSAAQRIVPVGSADSAECVTALKAAGVKVVLLAGCRMLSRQTLSAIEVPVLNYHSGIAPKYRGMNGGYWALAENDKQNFGATVHLVDAGVDTGDVLYQSRGTPMPGDNLTSYSLRLAAFSREICIQAVEDALADRLSPVDPGLPSRQWYHPPIWRYLWTGLRRGVW